MTIEVSRSILNFQGGFLGRITIAQCGFIDAFVVNNEFSVLVSENHASIKAMGNEPITDELCSEIAKQELGYEEFKIEQDGNCYYIYPVNKEDQL